MVPPFGKAIAIATASDTVTFTFAKRGFIQTIDFYTEGQTVVTPTPDTYLSAATAIKTIRGSGSVSSTSTTKSLTFASLNLTDGEQYTSPFDGDIFTATFAGGNNDGKYYNNGAAIRTYGGGTITITAKSDQISNITLTWSGSDKPNSNNVVNVGTYDSSSGVWTGLANSVVFTRPSGSGHWKLQSLSVTCASATANISNLELRFGIKIATAAWDAITTNGWEIQDYGVMMFLTTEAKLSSAPTVQSRYQSNRDLDNQQNLAVGRRESGLTPAIDGQGNYNFMVKVSIPNALPTPEGFNYDSYFCVRPFVKIDNQIYWLLEDDIQESVKSLAGGTNTGTNLDKDVLDYLAGL